METNLKNMDKKDFKELVDCLETRKRDSGEEFICRKDGTSEKITDIVHDVMYENTNNNFDLDYEIMDKALMFLSEFELKEIEESRDKVDERSYENEYASVYTGQRLSYLNNGNEPEIYDKQKEYESDIQTACAVWFDDQVRTVINGLLDKITE